ncbi:MAG: YggT family protein [Actinobacteria bacterium]|nr:YggT family protein [Actinomycetota bacterium]
MVEDILCLLLTIFIVLLFIRALLSWFPVEPGSFLAQLNDVLRLLTDWAVLPLRSVIPPVGMLDVSFLVLTFGLLILRTAICE